MLDFDSDLEEDSLTTSPVSSALCFAAYEDPNATATALRSNTSRQRMNPILIFVCLVAGLCSTGIGVLVAFDLIHCYSIPTSSMAPAIQSGDNVLMEGVSYHFRKPRRGDLLVFKADVQLPQNMRSQTYVKRLAGLPGEVVQIRDGVLFINGQITTLTNAEGPIKYTPAPPSIAKAEDGPVTVPNGSYYVLGDNSSHSMDSRDFGFVPASSVRGRIVFCYWPPSRCGPSK